jgi:hypothetical protein
MNTNMLNRINQESSVLLMWNQSSFKEKIREVVVTQENGRIMMATMAFLRDEKKGKGNKRVTYDLAEVLMEWDEERTIDAIFWICHNVGCWEDIREWCHELMKKDMFKYDGAVKRIVQRMNNQLFHDYWQKDEEKRSGISVWIPKEKSKYGGWLYDTLAVDWCVRKRKQPYLMKNMNILCLNKCRREYRKVCSALNQQQEQERHKEYEIRELIMKSLPPTNTTTEEMWNQVLTTESKGSVVNMMVLLEIAYEPRNYAKQIAAVCQAMHRMNRKQFICTTTWRWMEWSEETQWKEITSELWRMHYKSTTDKQVPFCITDFMKKKEAIERMTWIWITEREQPRTNHVHTPHMVYVNTSDEGYPCNEPRSSYIVATTNGISENEWNGIEKTSKKRNTNPWENRKEMLKENYQEFFKDVPRFHETSF